MTGPTSIPPRLVCQSNATTSPRLDSSSSSNTRDVTSTLPPSLKKNTCSAQQQQQHVRFSKPARKRIPLLRTKSAPVRARTETAGKPKDQQPASGSSSSWPLQSFMLQLTADKISYCHGTLEIAIHLDNAKPYSLPMETTPTQQKREPMSRTKSAPIQAYHQQPMVPSRSSSKPRRAVGSNTSNKVASRVAKPLSPMTTTRKHSQACARSNSGSRPGVARVTSFQSPKKSFGGATTSVTSPNNNKSDSPPMKPLRRSYSAPIQRSKTNNSAHLQPVSRRTSPEEEDRRNQLARLMRSPASVHKDTRWKNAVLDVNPIVLPDMVLHSVVSPAV